MDIYLNKVSLLAQEKITIAYTPENEVIEKTVFLSDLPLASKQIIYDFVALSSNQKIEIQSITANIIVNLFIKTITIIESELILPNRLTHLSPVEYREGLNFLMDLILE